MPPLHRLGNRCHLFEVKIPLILATLSRSLRSELMLFVLPSARTPRQQAQGSDSQGCSITNLSGCSFHSSAIKAEHLSRTGLRCRDGSPSFSWGCHIAAAQLSRQGITCTVPCQDTADATQHSSHCTEAFCPWEQSLAQLTASSCIQTCWVRGSLQGWGAAKVESRKKEIGCIQKAPRGLGNTKPFLRLSSASLHASLLIRPTSCSDTSWQSHRFGGCWRPAASTHLEGLQEGFLHSQPSVFGEQLGRDAREGGPSAAGATFVSCFTGRGSCYGQATTTQSP